MPSVGCIFSGTSALAAPRQVSKKILVCKSAAHSAYLIFLRARRNPLSRARRMLRGGINGESRHLSVSMDDARRRLTERCPFLTTSLGRAAGLRADALGKRGRQRPCAGRARQSGSGGLRAARKRWCVAASVAVRRRWQKARGLSGCKISFFHAFSIPTHQRPQVLHTKILHSKICIPKQARQYLFQKL